MTRPRTALRSLPMTLAAFAALVACDGANLSGGSNKSTTPRSAVMDPTGGSPGSGGTPGSGGSPGNGGVNGSGGATGGGDARVHAAGTGGNAGSGGNAGTGGGGSPGNGGVGVDGASSSNGKTGVSTDHAAATGTGTDGKITTDGGATGSDPTIAADGSICYTTIPTATSHVSTTNAPFRQMPGGAPIDLSFFNQWEPKSDDHPLPPTQVATGLLAGDELSVENISGQVHDGSDSGSCRDGVGQNDTLKHVLIIQLTDDSDIVQDPGVTTVKGLGALLLRDLETTKLKVPTGATRAYVSVGDTRYSDNHSNCSFTLVVNRRAPCPPKGP